MLAVAHSMLVTIYAVLKNQVDFQDLGEHHFDQANQDKFKTYCVRKLEAMGHHVILQPAA